MQPFDIDSQRLPQPHREGAAISAVRKAEVEARRAGRRNQSRLAVPTARENKVGRIDYSGIIGKDPPYDSVRLNEAHTKPLIRKARSARGFIPIEQRDELRRAIFVLDKARQPHMGLAVA